MLNKFVPALPDFCPKLLQPNLPDSVELILILDFIGLLGKYKLLPPNTAYMFLYVYPIEIANFHFTQLLMGLLFKEKIITLRGKGF